MLENILEDGAKFEIKEEETDGFTTLSTFIPKEYMGKVIGKNGRVINSIKNILKIKAIKENKKVDVQVTEQ